MTNTRIPRLVPAPRFLAALLLGVVVACPAAASPQVPRVVRFSGILPGVSGTASVLFAIYAEPSGGSPLWEEAQPLTVDAQGRYAVVLGGTRLGGLPDDLFASGEARWLGVRAEGHGEQPRVALLSVPYALKAADADTIAGKPLSAFVLAGDTTGVGADGLTYVDTKVLKQGLGASSPSSRGGSGEAGGGAQTSSGNPGYIGKFDTDTDLGNSILFQAGERVGVGLKVPEAPFHSAAQETPGAFFDVYNNALGALPVVYRAARGTLAAPHRRSERRHSRRSGSARVRLDEVLRRARTGDVQGGRELDRCGQRHVPGVGDGTARRLDYRQRADADHARWQGRHRDHGAYASAERRGNDR